MKYSFQITETFLDGKEKSVFGDFLRHKELDENVWGVFDCLFRSRTKRSMPLLLKAYHKQDLVGASVIIKCTEYGKAIFQNKLMSGFINLFRVPFYLWIKVGCCMDMVSNEGFVKDPDSANEVYTEMASFIASKFMLAIIYDYYSNAALYPKCSVLRSLPHALIDTRSMDSVDDYLASYKNLKKKIRVFHNKGGSYELIPEKLSDEDIESLKDCFDSTAKKSVIYLPYQDLNLSSAVLTCRTPLPGIYYFVARLNGDFLGYQAAVKSGSHLNALHGAFDRRRPTTFHAYDILFVKMTEFAIENHLHLIDVGVVLNNTKQKMVNKTVEMAYFIFSKYSILRWSFKNLLRVSRVQGREQMQYR